MERKILIDADIVAFKAASAAEKPINWGDGLWTLHAYEDEAKSICMDYFHNVVSKLSEDDDENHLHLFLTGGTNWRKDVLPTYKGNRKDTRKPIVLQALREWMVSDLGATIEEPFEADDLLGIESTLNGGIIVSEDKDLNTIPGLIFNPAKDTAPREVSVFDADYNHMMQTLTGDVTDGYPGCPTVGPKKAEAILKGCTTVSEMWEKVVEAYSKQKLSEEVALTQARVARICRIEDINRETMEVKLWTPPAS